MAIFREKEMILLDIIIHSARMPACFDNSAYLNIGFDKRVFPKIVWVPFRLQSHEPLMTYG